MITNIEVLHLFEDNELDESLTASMLINKFGSGIGSEGSVRLKLKWLYRSKSKKSKECTEFKKWVDTIFYQAHLGFKLKLKLRNKPADRTIRDIKRPIVSELEDFAEQQGVSFEEFFDILKTKCKKRAKTDAVLIPIILLALCT